MVAATIGLLAAMGGCKRSAPPAPTPAPPPSRTAVEATLSTAEGLLGAGRLEEAELVVARLCERGGGGQAALELHGRVLAGLAAEAGAAGRRDDAQALQRRALDQYDAALQAGPPSAGLLGAAGVIADAAGDLPLAADRYAAAAALEPDNPQYPLYEAQARLRLDDRAAARALAERVLEIRPGQPYALATLAEIAALDGRPEEAIERIAEARSADPDSLALRLMEARLRRSAGDPRTAAELLLALPDPVRVRPDVTRALARALMEADEPARAARAWEASHRSGLGTVEAPANAGLAWLEAGERDRAEAWLRVAEAEAPGAAATSTLGSTLRGSEAPGDEP